MLLQRALSVGHDVRRFSRGGGAAPVATIHSSRRLHHWYSLLTHHRLPRIGRSRSTRRRSGRESNGRPGGSVGSGGRAGRIGAGGIRILKVVAEQHGIALEDAARMFTERFPPSSGVKLDLRETACGRGLVATEAVEEGDTLLSVPWSQSIHVYEDGHEVSDDVRLALELLRVLNDGGDGEDDPRVPVWRDYSAMLPISTGAAAFWSPENIRELQYEPAIEKTLSLQEHFMEEATRHSSHSSLDDVEDEDEEEEEEEEDDDDDDAYEVGRYSKEEVLWALGMVHSRSFSVPTPSGRARALVPFCDLFNHRPESPADARKTDEVLTKRGEGLQEPWVVVGFPQSDASSTTTAANGGESPAATKTKKTVVATGTNDADDDDVCSFQMRAMWRFEPGEEVFISYGHETSAELLTSYGFFPEPNAGDFVQVYEDVQDLLDDDRWVRDDSLRLMMEKESVMWSMLAVDAPLAVRPGGISAAAHVLGCLRLVHAGVAELDYIRDDEVPGVGHSTFVWTAGPPGGLWEDSNGDGNEKGKGKKGGDAGSNLSGGGSSDGEELMAAMRAVDTAALGQAAARCAEMLEEDFSTTLEEDEELLRELEEAELAEEEELAEELEELEEGGLEEMNELEGLEGLDELDEVGAMQYITAVRYRVTVKRMLRQFLDECLAMGIQPSEY